VRTDGTVFAAYSRFGRAAIDALHSAMAVNMYPGRSLEAAAAVCGRTTVYTASFIIVVHMKPVDTFWAAVTIGFGTAE